MKKLLLSLALVLGMSTVASAAEVTFEKWNGYSWSGDANEWKTTANGYSIDYVKGTSSTDLPSPDQYSIRIYNGASVTFTSPEGVTFDKVVVTCNSLTKTTTAAASLGWTVGETDATTKTFEITAAAAQNSITLSSADGKQLRIEKIVITDNSTGTTEPDPIDPETPTNTSTAENPYTVTEALAFAQSLTSTQEVEAFAKGTVKAIKELSTSYGNATYTITDGTSDLSVYRGYYLDGAKFTAEDQLKEGDEVIVSGKLVNFKGNTPQFTTGSKILSINGETAPEVQTVDYADIAAFLKAANTTDNSRITGATTAVYQNGRYLWLKDNSGVLLAYNGGDIEMPKFVNGQTVEAGITGKYTNFSNGQLQMANLVEGTFKAGAQGAEVEPELMQVEDLATDLVNTYVLLKGVKLEATETDNTYTATDGSGSVTVFNQFSNSQYYDLVTVTPGECVDVYGFIAIHSGNMQLMVTKVTAPDGREVVAAPTFSVAAGAVAEGTEVEILCATEGATIYYTIDGTTPTAASTVYTTPVVINEALTLKAIAVKDGMDDSSVATAEYTIKVVGPITGTEAMFNFAEPTTLEPAYKAEGTETSFLVAEVPGVEFTNNGISVSSIGGSSTPRLWKCGTPDHGVEYRVYNGATTTISAAAGYVIKAVAFTGVQLTALQQDGTPLENATQATWTSADGVQSVVFDCVTNGSYKRADIVTIKVTFEKASQGIADVEVENAPVEYYNLQGVRMNGELTPGLYIRRQGNTATKVIVK